MTPANQELAFNKKEDEPSELIQIVQAYGCISSLIAATKAGTSIGLVI